jgi:NitT/TauT family transport system permease protein
MMRDASDGVTSPVKLWLDRKISRIALGVLIPGAILLLWHLASDSAVIPSIGGTFSVFLKPFSEPPNLDARPFATNIIVSILRVLTGFVLGAVTAVPLGILVGTSRVADRLIMPTVEVLRPICPIAWLPVAIIVFGLSSPATTFWGYDSWKFDTLDQLRYAMVFIIWWGAFFPIFVNTVAGVRGVKTLYLDAAKMLGARRWDMFRKVIFPASLPGILTGLRVGMGTAWMVIVAAEFFPGTVSGLGYLITASHQVAEYEYAFASIIVIGALGLFFNKGLLLLSDKLCGWTAKER